MLFEEEFNIEVMDEDAVRKYESIMAPANYKRPKPIFSKGMVEAAENTIKELGLTDSLKRRHATLDDVSADDMLYK